MTQTTPPQFLVSKTIHLTEPLDQPGPRPLRYGIHTFFQVSPTQIALLANLRVTKLAVVDHENGWDVFILDDISQLKSQNAVTGKRNHTEAHPKTGEPFIMVNHLPIGGFVPLGAKLPDGSPHPHAGTGFAMGALVGHPAHHNSAVPLAGGQQHGYNTIQQLKFDGKKLHLLSETRIVPDQFFPGWITSRRGLSPAIPDGPDLLFVHNGGQIDASVDAYFDRLKSTGAKPPRGANGPLGACIAPVISRWRGGPQGWHIVEMHRIPEPGPDMGGEPTLVRDTDGSLLCSIRGKGADVPAGERDALGLQNLYESFRVYRSTDNGKTWERRLCIHSIRAASPVTLNQLGDGSLFIAANPTYPITKDSKGRTIPLVMHRQRLWAWPLTPDRRNVTSPLKVFDAIERLGPARPIDTHSCDNHWYVDHPLAMPLRLGDGQWHNLMGFRVSDGATNSGGADAAPGSGLYLMELPGKLTIPAPWRFT